MGIFLFLRRNFHQFTKITFMFNEEVGQYSLLYIEHIHLQQQKNY